MRTILVADDNSNIQKMVSLVFEEKGVRVVAVGNGEAACRKLREVRPDLVLADVFMPVRNGYEVCEFVRQNPEAAETPVILLVGAFDPLDEKEAHRVGANGVLKKPFVPPEPLIEMVQSFLGKFGEPEAVPASAEPPAQNLAPEPKPQAAPPPSPPAQEVDSEEEPAEFAFGTSAKDIEEAGAAAAFAEPVATPSAKHEEEEDEDSEPKSAWSRNRETMDFDIPGGNARADDSRSAAEKDAPRKKHGTKTGFGGANVSFSDKPDSHHATSWMELSDEARESSEEAAPAGALPAASQPETRPAEPAQDDSAGVYHLQEESSSEQEQAAPFDQRADSVGDAMKHPAPSHGLPPAEAASTESVQEEIENVESADVSQEDPSLPASTATPPEIEIEIASSPVESAAPDASAYASKQTETSEDSHLAENSSPAAPSESATANSDSALDAAVAKVMEKLEPQIKEALANGVLRPLVKEMLEREREKK